MDEGTFKWVMSVRGLRPGSKVVLMVLADLCSASGWCSVAQDELASECEISKSGLNRFLAELEARELITRERTAGEHRHFAPTVYRVAFPKGRRS